MEDQFTKKLVKLEGELRQCRSNWEHAARRARRRMMELKEELSQSQARVSDLTSEITSLRSQVQELQNVQELLDSIHGFGDCNTKKRRRDELDNNDCTPNGKTIRTDESSWDDDSSDD